MSRKGGFGKLLVGAAIGAGLGLMFAPQPGTETRKCLKKKLDELMGKVKEIDPSDVKENILIKIDEIKRELEDLDKERALEIASVQAKKLQAKAEELYKYAVKKGTPILEKAADEVRIQTIKVAKEVVKKLETEEKPKTTKTTKKK